MTTILLADSQPAWRERARELLACHRDLDVVGESATDDTTVVATARLRPDIILMEINLSRPGGGFWAARRIREFTPSTSVVFHTSRSDLMSLVQAIHVGAAGYVVKGSGDQVLLAALLAVANGLSIAETGLGPPLAEAFGDQILTARTERLRPRERQVLALLQLGLSNASIAARLQLKTATVAKHVRGIVRKLEVHDRAGAASLTPDLWPESEHVELELELSNLMRIASGSPRAEVPATPELGRSRDDGCV